MRAVAESTNAVARQWRLQEFVRWVRAHVRGDEKGEAQVFLDRFLQAFEQPGILDVGGQAEFRVKKAKESGGGTGFADYVWKPVVLVEMKRRGVPLSRHHRQLFDYWVRLVPGRPAYAILCNFDEFWIYDFNRQMDVPVEIIALDQVPERGEALAFLYPGNEAPRFTHDHVEVTQKAAELLADVYTLLTTKGRGVAPGLARRFTMQALMALMTRGVYAEPARVELTTEEREKLRQAADADWSKVRPEIFGSLFEHSLGRFERRKLGAYFTSPVDVMKIVGPTIVDPWSEQIENATSLRRLDDLLQRMLAYRVLDPACGSGNFLYIAYRELKRLEARIHERRTKLAPSSGRRTRFGLVGPRQFFGIDIDPLAVDLAMATLAIAHRLVIEELGLTENPLPLQNLRDNFLVGDALVRADGTEQRWPAADVIIGNPPFIGAKRLKPERGSDYVSLLRRRYPTIPGMADYCVYWFRRAQDALPDWNADEPEKGRAGLVGTQNVRNNRSRSAGLDHIAGNATIVDAVVNQPWSGDANVHVSIVNWVKGQPPGQRTLWKAVAPPPGDRPPNVPPYELEKHVVAMINSALSNETDVSEKKVLPCNRVPKRCYQGKIPGYEGFMLDHDAARRIGVDSREVVVPYLTGRELLDPFRIDRWAIDFGGRNLEEAAAHRSAFEHCRSKVLPAVRETWERAVTKKSDMAGARKEHLDRWWQFWNRRDELTSALARLPRYIGCSRVTRRPIMAFIASRICPSDLVQVFAFDDDYSFGVLQSSLHFEWFRKSSRLKVESDMRYSVREVFETFPWPQGDGNGPDPNTLRRVAEAARLVRRCRIQAERGMGGGLRAVYRLLELPGKSPLKDAHAALDEAVREAYGFEVEADPLASLLALNAEVASRCARGSDVASPGLPKRFATDPTLRSSDCYDVEGT